MRTASTTTEQAASALDVGNSDWHYYQFRREPSWARPRFRLPTRRVGRSMPRTRVFLTVTPACTISTKFGERQGAKLAICNLQKTPVDDITDYRIFTETDTLMANSWRSSSWWDITMSPIFSLCTRTLKTKRYFVSRVWSPDRTMDNRKSGDFGARRRVHSLGSLSWIGRVDVNKLQLVIPSLGWSCGNSEIKFLYFFLSHFN